MMPTTTSFDHLRSTIAAAAELHEPGTLAPLTPGAAVGLLDRALSAAQPSLDHPWVCVELLRLPLLDAASRDGDLRDGLLEFLAPSLGRLHGGDWTPRSWDQAERHAWGGFGDSRVVAAVDLFLALGGALTPEDAEHLVESFPVAMAGASGCRVAHHPSFPIRLLPKLLGFHWKSYRTSTAEAGALLTSGPRLNEFLEHRPTRAFMAKRLFGGRDTRQWPIHFAPGALWAASMQPQEWAIVIEAMNTAIVGGFESWAWEAFLNAIPREVMAERPEHHTTTTNLLNTGLSRYFRGALARFAGVPEWESPAGAVVEVGDRRIIPLVPFYGA